MSMEIEINRQDLARRLVDREIYYCISSLVSTLSTLAQHCYWKMLRDEGLSWEDDILPLLEGTDYDEAGETAINDEDDLDTIEKMAESYDWWDDILESVGFTSDIYSNEISELSDKIAHLALLEIENDELSDNEEAARNAAQERLDALKDEPLETWLAEDDTRLDAIKAEMIKRVSDWEAFCRDNDVNTDDYRSEVYEHWIVSDWLARKLKERGYVVGELCGLTIWGRQCTGQAIYLDYGIQQIAMELWPEDVLKEESDEQT